MHTLLVSKYPVYHCLASIYWDLINLPIFVQYIEELQVLLDDVVHMGNSGQTTSHRSIYIYTISHR